MTITFNIYKQHLELREKLFIASDTVNYIDCKFYFSREWSGFEKTAVFSNVHESYSVLLNKDTCTVPHEILSDTFSVSVFGTQNGTNFKRITTNTAVVQVVESGYKVGGTPSEPMPSRYEKIVLRMIDNEKQIKVVKDINTQLDAKIKLAKRDISENKTTIKSKMADCDTEIVRIKSCLDKSPENYAAKTHIHKPDNVLGLSIPDKTSQLENDSGYVEDEKYVHTDNNYTDAHKAKLAAFHEYDDTQVKADIEKKADTISTIRSGYPIVLTDHLSNHTILSLKVYGNDNGIGDLSSSDGKYHISVRTFGKNILNPKKYLKCSKWSMSNGVYQGHVSQLYAIYGNITKGLDVPLRGKKLAISFEAKNDKLTSVTTYFQVHYTDGAKQNIGAVNSTSWTKYSGITNSTNISKIVMGYANEDLVYLRNLQISESDELLEYEPYEETLTEAILDTPLISGEYIDLISKKRVNGSAEIDIAVTGEPKTVNSKINNILCNTSTAPNKMDVTYYQDINKVIMELKNAILAQGSNT